MTSTANPAALTVRRVRPTDLPIIVSIHVAAFPEAALTAFGTEAVRRYYQWQCNPVHDASGLVAEQEGRVAGFYFAGLFQGAMSGFLQENWC